MSRIRYSDEEKYRVVETILRTSPHAMTVNEIRGHRECHMNSQVVKAILGRLIGKGEVATCAIQKARGPARTGYYFVSGTNGAAAHERNGTAPDGESDPPPELSGDALLAALRAHLDRAGDATRTLRGAIEAYCERRGKDYRDVLRTDVLALIQEALS